MADQDVQAIVDRLKAARGGPSAGIRVQPVAPDTTAPSPDASRAYSRDALMALGYDDATIESVAPAGLSAGVASDMAPDSLDHINAAGEAQQLIDQRESEGIHMPQEIRTGLVKFLNSFDDDILPGLASINKHIDKFAEDTGEKVASTLMSRGSNNLTLGMALLDNFNRWNNKMMFPLVPPEKRAEFKLKYLPTEKLIDPSIDKEFETVSDMAMWALGQKVWGATNTLAALPPEQLSKALGMIGMADAAAFMADLAARDKAVAAKQGDIMTGQMPQLIAGQAPMLSYQDVVEAHWDPTTLDNIYAQFDDPGVYGPATAAAISGLFTIADFYASPLAIAGTAVARLTTAGPRIAQAVSHAKAAKAASGVARETYRWEDAKEAVKAAQNNLSRTQAKVAAAAEKRGGTVTAAERNTLVSRERALAREEHWASQFEDPGTYEPIMIRPARRNPEYIPELTERQYPLSAGGRSSVRIKSLDELAIEPIEAEVRRKTLVEGAHMPVKWDGTLELGKLSQRIVLGPDDGEYAGDALNMIARGAEIDDVSMSSGLAPEYYVLPDVQTSLVDIRAITEANRFERARRLDTNIGGEAPFPGAPRTRPLDVKPGEMGPSHYVLNQRLKAAGAAPEAVPGQRPEVLTSEELLRRNEEVTRQLLTAAKARGDKMGSDELRGQLRQMKQIRKNLQTVKAEPFDRRMLPGDQPGIMESPERFNRWLDVAGNRVVRSMYPGGLMIHGWNTKLGQMLSMAREPMRYYQTYDPAAWERVRSGVMRYDRFVKSTFNVMKKENVRAGVITERTGFDPIKHFSPEKMDHAAGDELFDLLNSTVKDERHLSAYEAATPDMRQAHDRIRAVLDHFADLQGISETERYLVGYMRHVVDQSVFAGGARPMEFIGLPAKYEVFASHLLQRNGSEGYIKDPVLALDLYVRAAYRKLIMEPVYADIIKTGEELAKKHGNTAHISYANDLVNQLKGKPSFVGAKVDEAIGSIWNAGGGVKLPFSDKKIVYRPGDLSRTAQGIFSLTHSGLTTSPHYAILQLASGITTTAGRIGPFDTMRGLFQMATKEGQQLSKAAGTYKPFVDFLESPTVRKFTETVQKKFRNPPLFISNQHAEDGSRGITHNAAIKMYMRKAGFKTLKEAEDAGQLKRIYFEAVRTSEEANHLYGPLGRNPWVTRVFGRTISTGAQQLLSYIPKQSEEIMAQTARNPGFIVQYLALSGQLVRMAAEAGVDMTGDVGLGYLPESPSDITSPAVDAGLDILRLNDALDRGDAEGTERIIKSLTKSLTALVPGSQTAIAVSKAAQRLGDQSVRTASGDKLYTMNRDEETLPTVLMQRNIHETLTRRGIQANRQEDKRFAYNLANALEDYAEAIENHDEEAATELATELSNVYKYGAVTGDQVVAAMTRAREARDVAYTVRSVLSLGNDFEKYMYLENLRKHGVNMEP